MTDDGPIPVIRLCEGVTDNIPPIADDAAHQMAMEEIDRLWGDVHGPESQDRLLALMRVIYAYERSRWAPDHFLTITTDERRLVSPERLAGVLELQIKDLARLLRTSPNALRDDWTSPAVQRDLRSIVEILSRATAVLLGGPQRAIDWFKFRRLESLGNDTPAQLVEAGHRDAVVHYLGLLENGIYG